MKACASLALIGLWLLSVQEPVWASTPSPTRVPDGDITYWVKDALRYDHRIESPDVTVACKDGIVTLSGAVSTLAAREYADLEAKKINGVMGVINELRVTPAHLPDSQIQQDVRRRVLSSAAIESQGIVVTCTDGKVTLSGKAASWTEKQAAGLLATEVRGVNAVTNNLWAEQRGTRTDRELEADAMAALERDAYLSGLPITASVKDGVLTLHGTVGNPYERQRAQEGVRWLRAVKEVKNDLTVDRWENHGVRKEKPLPADGDLRLAARMELEHDRRLLVTDLEVQASQGHVTLEGSVPTHLEKRIAEQDAHDVVGVGWVTNNLFVRTEAREDWAIRDDVQFNLHTDARLQASTVDARVHDGVVSLSGDVHSWYDKVHAGDVAARIRGVGSVVNNIEVTTARNRSDAELARFIRDRLRANWTTEPVSTKIQVKVQNGIAELSGDVYGWAERTEAQHVAMFTRGIWAVDNRLTVNGYDYPWDEWHYKGSYLRDPLLAPFVYIPYIHID